MESLFRTSLEMFSGFVSARMTLAYLDWPKANMLRAVPRALTSGERRGVESVGRSRGGRRRGARLTSSHGQFGHVVVLVGLEED